MHTVLEADFGASSGSFRTAPDSGSGFWWIFRMDQTGFDNALAHPDDPLPEPGAVLNDPEDPPKPTSSIFEERYAYLPQPMIIKNAFMDWKARKQLTFQYLKEVYNRWPDALNHFSNECQFLPFKSVFATLNEFFNMPESDVNSGNPPWYVGFSNCHPNILKELRELYPRPHFLPTDAELPNTDYTFLGEGEGAVMHLDYIPRLMWQAQLQGNKTWFISPTPECDSKCSSFSFYVEAGDAVLIDTRIWYHGTITGQFSITIQSEYG
ncbi:uncharacterized protein LOC129573790 isoform X2 [Sitodiplosis mosellana]|uniref:uncharacterized protein LOC129573790 isoform X2 n=1 Tax=Sitodiplosis mosellana TaxID=263140 RepID=UPI0024440EDB|nr:uncharacterized protein LOC129573790 isoform X2 [Sitodiplosis mosellana]